VNSASEKGIKLKRFLQEALVDYEYGLKLVGKKKFTITGKVIADSKAYLNSLVKKSYKSQVNNT